MQTQLHARNVGCPTLPARVHRTRRVLVNAASRPILAHGRLLRDPAILSASHRCLSPGLNHSIISILTPLQCCLAYLSQSICLSTPSTLPPDRSHDVRVPVVADHNADINAYMKMLGRDLSILKMPLGANLVKIGGDEYEITVPKIQLFDVWFQPKANAIVSIKPDVMSLECRQCVLDGSHHVTDLKLNDVFNVLVQVRFTWQDGKRNGVAMVNSSASLDVDVDVPFPFSAMPRSALEAAGNIAFQGTLAFMLNGFVSNLLTDFDQWSKNPAAREARARQQAAAAAVYK